LFLGVRAWGCDEEFQDRPQVCVREFQVHQVGGEMRMSVGVTATGVVTAVVVLAVV